ncbi:MAG TPA: DNA mismatch repair protein MutS [Methanothrix sp.]|nr:DNA mismatch repair protein MutS [Methanothrix sp.]
MSRLSPLMEQYYREKSRYPDALLLFRVGDFYETFAEDAVVVARDLNITLTSRQKDDEGNKIPLAGVPYHALDAYLARLIRAGHKVAICDQVEDPKLARGLVKREITRVVTPGTVVEPAMLDESSNNFLAAVVVDDGGNEGKMAGLAFLDVSTGEFLTTVVSYARLPAELAKFRPAECISATPLPWEGGRQQILVDAVFSEESAAEALKERFGSDWGQHQGLESRPLCARACGAVLAYLRMSRFEALGHLQEIRYCSGSEFLVLDDVTLRNLEVLRNIRDRSRRGTLLEYLGHTKTAMGARTLARWIEMPLLSRSEIARRLDGVQELKEDGLLREGLMGLLKGCADLERLLSRITLGLAGPKELVVLRSTLQKLPELQMLLAERKSPILLDLSSRLSPLPEMAALLDRAIIDDPPTHIREGGVIRDGYDEEVDRLRSLLRDGRGWMARLEGEEREKTGIKSLKVAYNNVFGYYLEVTRANLHLVPEHYIRKQTLANVERFIIPELKDMESQILSAQDRSVSLEQEIFARLAESIAKEAHAVQDRAAAIAEADVLLALAVAAAEGGLVKPQFDEPGGDESNGKAGRLYLRAARHPVLDRAMRGSFVPNDVLLDGGNNRFIILTGPNMAGKSTFMRQVALCCIMAQAGSFVPADFAELPILDRIFTRVGAYDDLSAGQSTFMVEMKEIAAILAGAGRSSLVLLDEVGRGTSTFDGLSLAWAISEYLHSSIQCKCIFATHYHQLTQLEGLLPGIKNYSIAVKEEKGTVTFLRTVVPGATDKSYGVHVARLAGLPEAVTRRADQILKEIEKEAVIEPLSRSKKAKRSSRYTQLIFFDSPTEGGAIMQPKEDSPILEEIRSLDIDAMTPRQALERLAEYQKKLEVVVSDGENLPAR